MKWLAQVIRDFLTVYLGDGAGQIVDDKAVTYIEKLEKRLDAQDARLAQCEERHLVEQAEILALHGRVDELESEIKALQSGRS